MEFTYIDRPQTSFEAPLRRPLRVNNVVRRLNLPERTIRHLAQTGRLRAFKLDGKSWGFWPKDVDDYKLIMEADNAELF
jgi:excisionase family DNA binding protein